MSAPAASAAFPAVAAVWTAGAQCTCVHLESVVLEPAEWFAAVCRRACCGVCGGAENGGRLCAGCAVDGVACAVGERRRRFFRAGDRCYRRLWLFLRTQYAGVVLCVLAAAERPRSICNGHGTGSVCALLCAPRFWHAADECTARYADGGALRTVSAGALLRAAFVRTADRSYPGLCQRHIERSFP